WRCGCVAFGGPSPLYRPPLHRRGAEGSAELMPRRRRGGMGWETREQTCPHEWGHGSLEGCSTVWVTAEKTTNQTNPYFFALSWNASSDSAPGRGFHASEYYSPRSRAHGSNALTTCWSSGASSGMVRTSTRFSGDTCWRWPLGVPSSISTGPGPLFFTQSSPGVEENSGRKLDVKKRSRKIRREAFRMNTTNCVSEIANPCGRVDSASQPTTVSTSSTLSTRLPLGWPRQSLMGFPPASSWASVIVLEASQVCCP